MPQTGTTEGHAHLHEDGGSVTTATDNHWHRINKGQPLTSKSIPVGSETENPEGHQHEVPDQ